MVSFSFLIKYQFYKGFIYELSKEDMIVYTINLIEDFQTSKVFFPTPKNLIRSLPFSES